VSGRLATVLGIAGGAALGGVATLIARAVGAQVPWSVPVLAGVVAGGLVAAAARLPAGDPELAVPSGPAAASLTASFGDLGTLRFIVEQDSRDGDRFQTRLRPRLAALIVERLWQQHRLDWRADADRAAAADLLGPELLALLAAPPHTLQLTPRTLSRWTRALEDL
jgi:hypothetical protein